MTTQSTIAKNINKCLTLRIFLFFWFPLPTLLVFLNSHGLGISELMLLKSCLSLTCMLGEVPTGYFADRFGRRISIILGYFFCGCGSILYCLGTDLSTFLVGEALLGIGISFVSGADSALVFDSLQEMKEEHRYGKIESSLSAWSGYAEALGGLIGAALAAINLALPFLLQTVFFIVALGIALTLVEPKSAQSAQAKTEMPSVRKIMHASLYQNKQLSILIYFSAFLGLGTYATVFLAQAYMQAAELPVAYFGLAWALFHIVLGIASHIAHRVEAKFSRIQIFVGLSVILLCSYFLLTLGASYFSLLAISAIYFVRGLRQPLIRSWINPLTTSDVRATVLSTHAFVMRLFFVILGPILGYAIDIIGLFPAVFYWTLMLSLSLAASLLSLWNYEKSLRGTP